MKIIKLRKFFVLLTLVVVIASIIVISLKGFKFSIEFTGGSLLELSYAEGERPDIANLRETLEGTEFASSLIQPLGDNGFVLKTETLDDAEKNTLVNLLSQTGESMIVERFNSIGPSVGKQLQTKSLYALIGVSLATLLFIAYAFRKVSGVVPSWKYGVIAVGLLVHDILVTVGILTLLSIEVDTLYVVGLLSILGLSINNTVVVFDRIRENLLSQKHISKDEFLSLVGNAVTQTLHRSILMSLTLVFALAALLFVGPDSTKNLSLVLLIGIFVGTYSSILLSSSLLSYMFKETAKK